MIDESTKKAIRRIPGTAALYMLTRKLLALPGLIHDYRQYKTLAAASRQNRFSVNISDLQPILIDKTSTTQFEPHYVYHPAWAARIIASNHPERHVDISSILQFSTIISAFVPVEFYDYRPANLTLSNFTSQHADLTQLHFKDNSIASLSCMHTVEHIGLGRYGDPIDPDGDLKAARELTRVLAPKGTLLFVTPVGKPKIAFNAHRIYSYEHVLALFSTLTLKEFSLVPDNYREAGFINNANPALVKDQDWGCGCFYFTKSD